MGVDRRRFLEAASSRRSISENNAYAYARSTTGALYWSQDAGSTWSVRNTNIQTDGALAALKNNAVLASGTRRSALWYFDKSGNYAAQSITGITNNLCASSGSEYVYYTVNAGSSWQTGYSTQIYKKTGRAGRPVLKKTFSTWDQSGRHTIACSADGKYVCIGGLAGYTNGFTSIDYGETWVEALATSSYGNGATSVDMSNDGRYTLVGSQGGLNRSVNSLASFTHDTNSNIYSIAISGDGRVMYRNDSNLILYRSLDYGASWQQLLSSFGAAKLVCSYTGQVVLCVAYYGGTIFRSNDYGKSWSQILSVACNDIVINNWGV